jgi:hypothetical protein
VRRRTALAVCLIASGAACTVNRVTPVPTTVCSVVSEPYVYSRKVIEVRAFVVSDGRHLTLLKDASCNDVGIALVINDDIWDSEGSVAIRRALASQSFGAPSKQISGTFTGVFRLRPGEVPLRVLQTRAITNVQIINGGAS